MPSPPVIDMDELIAPIQENTPCGEDVRMDRSALSDYFSIKDARNNARAAERANLFGDDDNPQTIDMWRTVASLARRLLTEKTKDIEIASWYLESLLRLHGIVGLRDGFTLLRILVEKYWHGLYPTPDEDGLESKVAPLAGLNGDGAEGTLLSPIRNAMITDESSFGTFSFWQYQQAHSAERITDSDQREARIDELGFSLETIEDTLNDTDIHFYIGLIEDLEISKDEHKKLNTLLREHCADDAPVSSNISNLLDEVLRTVRFINKARLEESGASLSDDAGDDSAQINSANQNASARPQVKLSTGGAIKNRDVALQRLKEVADFFHIYEPHTPLAPAIERIIQWGQMSVSQLMVELLPEQSARTAYTQLTGVSLDGSDAPVGTSKPSVALEAAPDHVVSEPEDRVDDNTEQSTW